jgi:RimJ/RimL family protein N-acetyltransferase
LAKAYWGMGIATEAVKQATERGFSDLDIVRIEALVDPENIGSIRVLEKAGFSREAYLKNYVVHRARIRDRIIYAKIL